MSRYEHLFRSALDGITRSDDDTQRVLMKSPRQPEPRELPAPKTTVKALAAPAAADAQPVIKLLVNYTAQAKTAAAAAGQDIDALISYLSLYKNGNVAYDPTAAVLAKPRITRQ